MGNESQIWRHKITIRLLYIEVKHGEGRREGGEKHMDSLLKLTNSEGWRRGRGICSGIESQIYGGIR